VLKHRNALVMVIILAALGVGAGFVYLQSRRASSFLNPPAPTAPFPACKLPPDDALTCKDECPVVPGFPPWRVGDRPVQDPDLTGTTWYWCCPRGSTFVPADDKCKPDPPPK